VQRALLEFRLKRGLLLCFLGRFLSSNVYLIVVGNEAVAVDCGMFWDANRVLAYLRENRVTLKQIFLTHSHFDHVSGMNRLKERVGTQVVAHVRSKKGNVMVRDGDIIDALHDQLSFQAIYIGRHKADHVWYFERNNRLLFVGDYLPTLEELNSFKERHEVEPEVILPGHGEPARTHVY